MRPLRESEGLPETVAETIFHVPSIADDGFRLGFAGLISAIFSCWNVPVIGDPSDFF